MSSEGEAPAAEGDSTSAENDKNDAGEPHHMSLRDATNILKREALKQYQAEEVPSPSPTPQGQKYWGKDYVIWPAFRNNSRYGLPALNTVRLYVIAVYPDTNFISPRESCHFNLCSSTLCARVSVVQLFIDLGCCARDIQLTVNHRPGILAWLSPIYSNLIYCGPEKQCWTDLW